MRFYSSARPSSRLIDAFKPALVEHIDAFFMERFFKTLQIPFNFNNDVIISLKSFSLKHSLAFIYNQMPIAGVQIWRMCEWVGAASWTSAENNFQYFYNVLQLYLLCGQTTLRAKRFIVHAHAPNSPALWSLRIPSSFLL